ncbi:MAG: LysM peptidoglycan-binding domain-containing protein [Bdellovibrionales bacterium]|nr:LysM peptidoglycan-binding domain-containing protein [Bdellovibrionales bacterium]
MKIFFTVFINSFLIMTLVTPFFAFGFSSYVIKKGDKLSIIAHKLIPGKVWTSSGSLSRLLGMNSQIKNPNLIFPGDVIIYESRKQSEPKVSTIESELPPPKVKATSVVEFQRIGKFEFTPFYRFVSLDLKDLNTGETATLASRYNLGIGLNYVQCWQENFQTNIAFNLSTINFQPPSDSAKQLHPLSQFQSGLNLGATYKFNNSFEIGPSIGIQQELFGRSITTNKITTDIVAIPSLGAKVSYDIKHLTPFTVGVTATAELKLAGKADDYQIRQGEYFGGGIYLKQKAQPDRLNLKTEIGFYMRNQGTSLVNQSEKSIILSLKVY